ncbi:MAG: sigma-54 dependent transcriptional regulator [Candidatus Margulisbacteria bacterium]|nr:sigma-54 dependent transcriptional regulator [Candidatus Margulisiibacteriota bacterium]
MEKARILIVDDERSIRDSMKMLLEGKYDLLFAEDGKTAVDLAASHKPDLILLDIRLPEMSGLDALAQIKDNDPDVDVIMVTALNTVETAVTAIKRGAYDYITKPFDIDAIQYLIERALERRYLQKEVQFLRGEVDRQYKFEKMVGRSRGMVQVFELIGDVAKSDATVLISGESGTGKEMVARAIHNTSSRANKLFVPLNCAAIPENLLESELFGHERGAFTGAFERKLGKFEIADTGTLFLDEIGSLPIGMQGKLLRVLQDRIVERVGGTQPFKVDVRIIAATNIDLKKEINDSKFRKDLYYRLNVFPIDIPPLRERRDDIILLISYFIEHYNREFGRSVEGFDNEALMRLVEYDWPGNVRELQNLIERMMVLTRQGKITLERLPKEIVGLDEADMSVSDIFTMSDMSFKEASKRFEAAFIKRALEKAGGRKSRAAELMGIHRNTLLQIERKVKDLIH